MDSIPQVPENRLLARVIANMPDCFILLDRDWRIQFINESGAHRLGTTPQSLAGSVLWEVWPSVTGTQIEHRLRAVGETGEAVRFEYHDAEAGPDVWLKIHAFQSDGHLLAVQYRDISSRKHEEQQLQSKLSFVESIIEGTPDPIFVKDLEGRFLIVNNACAKVLGLPRQQLIGKRDAELLNEAFAGPIAEVDQRVMTTGKTEVVEEWLLENGVRRLYLSTKSAWRNEDGAIIGLIGVARDITDRKRQEEALQNSQDRLQLALAAGQMGTWDHDLKTGNIQWSDGHFRLWGFQPGELSPNIEIFRSRLHPSDKHHVREVVQNAIDSDSDYAMQYRVVWPDESVHWVEARGKVVSEDGIPVRTIGVVTDHTLRKRTEDKLREAARLESLGILAGGVAHDFNNLLTGIIGNASLLHELIPEGSPQATSVAQILAAGERASELTRQMLAYSGKGSFLIELMDLSQEVAEIVPLLKSTIGSQVVLQLNLSSNLPGIAADPAQIQQLVMNLVINAAEAVGSKAGSVSVSTDLVEVDALYARSVLDAFDIKPGMYVRLEVKDTGHGMDESILSKIFDPFFTTKFTGRGLGLAAVQGIIRGLRGALAVVSKPGQGTTFQVFLPPDNVQERTSRPALNVTRKRFGKCVLVADDEVIVQRIARRALEKEGYRVLVVNNGQEAIDLLKESQDSIDVMILDLTMPVMGGEEALPVVRQLRPGLIILASSGYSEADVLQRLGPSVHGFIQKPYTARRLIEQIDTVLERPAG